MNIWKIYKNCPSQRLFFSIILLTFLLSCASSKNSQQPSENQEKDTAVQLDQGTVIKVDNPTGYNVYFVEKNQKISKRSNGTVTLSIEEATLTGGFDIWYEIPLSDTVPLFVKGDHRTIREVQSSLTIKEPSLTENYGTFIAINNRADNAITFHAGGTVEPLWEQLGTPSTGAKVARTDKREFYKTGIFGISGNFTLNDYYIRDSRKNIPLVLPLNVKMNYLYAYDYGAKGLEFTDARPLHRVGESGRVETIADAAGPMPVVSAENEIYLFASTDKGLVRKVFDSSIKEKVSVPSGDSFDIRFASSAQDGFFIAGYEELANGDHKPVARIHDKNGVLLSILEPSMRQDCHFISAGQKDNANWLLSGGSRENPAQGYRAYVRQVRNEGSRLAVLWELTGDDFDGKTSGVKCGNITAALYARGFWLVAGEILAFDVMGNPVKASFTAEISNEGKIQKVDTSFKNMTINKIVMDSNGVCYLAGDEQRGNESYAILVKYGVNARQTPSQPASHSYYQDAMFDALYNRIILTGTLRAKNEAGNGGVPFIDAVDAEKGTLLWREELSDIRLNKTSLVTAVKPAPDYGFVITLSGVSDYYDKPYMIARINSQGKLIKELQK
jgi:hypothetical protein